MFKKTTTVRAHIRKGKPVRSHMRNFKVKSIVETRKKQLKDMPKIAKLFALSPTVETEVVSKSYDENLSENLNGFEKYMKTKYKLKEWGKK